MVLVIWDGVFKVSGSKGFKGIRIGGWFLYRGGQGSLLWYRIACVFVDRRLGLMAGLKAGLLVTIRCDMELGSDIIFRSKSKIHKNNYKTIQRYPLYFIRRYKVYIIK